MVRLELPYYLEGRELNADERARFAIRYLSVIADGEQARREHLEALAEYEGRIEEIVSEALCG